MFKLSTLIKNYRETGALNEHINLVGFINNHAFLTKSGDIGLCLTVSPVDFECADEQTLERTVKQFEASLKLFDERFTLYQTLQKKSNADSDKAVHMKIHQDHSALQPILSRRKAHFTAHSSTLFHTEITWTVLYRGFRYKKNILDILSKLFTHSRQGLAELSGYFSQEKEVLLIEAQIDTGLSILHQKVNSFKNAMNDTIPLTIKDKQSTFTFLYSHLNFTPSKVSCQTLARDTFLDYAVCGSTIDCFRDHLKVDDYIVKVLTLKEPPAWTTPNILKHLHSIQANFFITTEFTKETVTKSRKDIQTKRRHFHNSKTSIQSQIGQSEGTAMDDVLIDDAKEALVSDLGDCLKDMEMNGSYFGSFSLTVVVFDKNAEKVEKAVAEFFKLFSTLDATLIDERYNLLNAFLATIPGNTQFNLRTMYLLNTNVADCSFLFGIHNGKPCNHYLKSEYLACVESNFSSPYYLNLHYQDVGHTMILGSTGSGKSVLLNFLIAMCQKYNGHTIIFDIGGSYTNLTRQFSGSTLKLTGNQWDATINPFSLKPTNQNLDVLFHFLQMLIGSTTPLNMRDEKIMRDSIRQIYHLESSQRTLSTLSKLLPDHLSELFTKWIGKGIYGRFFDNVTDTLTVSRFQCYDFEGLDTLPAVLQPLLYYILHRADCGISSEEHAGAFKTFVLDETWKFLNNEAVKHYMSDALKTWRKKNAVMLLATQSPQDLIDSSILRTILESCPTRIYLSNKYMDKTQYAQTFKLNDIETDTIASLIPKKQFLITQPDTARLCNLNIPKENLAIYTPGNRQENQYV